MCHIKQSKNVVTLSQFPNPNSNGIKQSKWSHQKALPLKIFLQNTLFWKNNKYFLSMDSVKVLGSLDYSVFIFSKLHVSPVRSSLIYLVKRFNIYIYNFCAVKKYGRWWFFDCSCICSHKLHGIKAIHEPSLTENVRLKPMFISDQPNFWLGYFKYILCN